MDLTEKGSQETPFSIINETNGRNTKMQQIYLSISYMLWCMNVLCIRKLPLN